MTDPVSGTLRMRGDRILLKPLEWEGREVHGEGSQIAVVRSGRPLRGVVVAVGPGIHPVSKRVRESDTRKRIEFSKHFRPTEVKPGDIVELGGLNIFDGKGYQFPEVLLNGETHLIVTERDVCVVHEAAVPNDGVSPILEAAAKIKASDYRPIRTRSNFNQSESNDASRRCPAGSR